MNTIRVAPVELIQSLLSMTFFLRTNGRTDKRDPRRPKNVKKLLPKVQKCVPWHTSVWKVSAFNIYKKQSLKQLSFDSGWKVLLGTIMFYCCKVFIGNFPQNSGALCQKNIARIPIPVSVLIVRSQWLSGIKWKKVRWKVGRVPAYMPAAMPATMPAAMRV